ncbi:MAG: DUF3459 domain-containing protein [Phycisphaerales bacterium]|nr:MAG: DUF3459 domain-containing protein [Phycisphaerales bacterium]
MRARPRTILAIGALVASLAGSCARVVAQSPASIDAPATTRKASIPEAPQSHWWNDAIGYEIFVRSFKDSSSGPLANDGVGDLRGLIDSLDYLNDNDPSTDTDLGINLIWLMPIMESPSYHGYDITDYRTIDREYGTNDDFRELVQKCHTRGIRVVIDHVVNHCSWEHPWFKESRDPGSPKRDWFIWSFEDPGWKGLWHQPVWHHTDKGFYYGMFWKGMPDLNYRNADVTKEMEDITRYWLHNYDVDGVRLDAIRHLIEDGQIQENTPETHAWLKEYNAFCKSLRADSLTIGEVWSPTAEASKYIPDELDLVFEFELADATLHSIVSRDATKLRSALEGVLRSYPRNQFSNFLTNHDMNRVMSVLKGDETGARLAAAIMLLGPGMPFLYYGEEIGLSGEKPDERLRTPMPWTGAENLGFTIAKLWQAPQPDYATRNIATQASDPASLLNWYKKLIRVRLSDATLRRGDTRLVSVTDPRILAFERTLEGESRLVVVNLGDEPIRDAVLKDPDARLSRFASSIDVLTSTPHTGQSLTTAKAIVPISVLEPRRVYLLKPTP